VIGILASLLLLTFGTILELDGILNNKNKEIHTLKSLESERNPSEFSGASNKRSDADNIEAEPAGRTESYIIKRIADKLGEKVTWSDEVFAYVIPVEGDSPKEVFDNSLSVMQEINDSVIPLMVLKSLGGVEHFYFRIIDKDGLIVMERNMSSDGDVSYFTIGVDYLVYMN
jgi:hypothetical protein